MEWLAYRRRKKKRISSAREGCEHCVCEKSYIIYITYICEFSKPETNIFLFFNFHVFSFLYGCFYACVTYLPRLWLIMTHFHPLLFICHSHTIKREYYNISKTIKQDGNMNCTYPSNSFKFIIHPAWIRIMNYFQRAQP